MSRLLIITEAGRAWPSGQLRGWNYREMFEAVDVQTTLRSVQSERLVGFSEQIHGLPGIGSVLSHAATKLNHIMLPIRCREIIALAKDHDVIYLQKVGNWELIQSLRALADKYLVYDLNDAVWLPKWRAFLGGRVSQALTMMDAVTCDNPYGVEFARHHNSRVFLVPDNPQVDLYDRLRATITKDPARVVIGWIGSEGTMYHLYACYQALEALWREHPRVELRLIGVGKDKRLMPPFERVRFTTIGKYDQQELIRQALQLDIGLFPLFDVEDGRMRGVLKAAVYMSAGCAVVASPVGQIAEMLQDGVTGLLASTPHEWLHKLRQLVASADMRRAVGERGLAFVREHYSNSRCFRALFDALFAEEKAGEIEGR